MWNCLSISSPKDVSKRKRVSPIETAFKLPSPLPTWPPGEGFASGTVDLGGLHVCQITSFTKVWEIHQGGPDNDGATFFEPKSIPDAYYMLGCYAQPNNTLLFGSVLVAKEETGGDLLKQPIDYNLVWSSDGNGYIWLPIAPEGYQALGHIVTNTPNKPSLDKIRCVRSDFTEPGEAYKWIWGPGKDINTKDFNVFGLRPMNRGSQNMGVCVGTFVAQNPNASAGSIPTLPCLKNVKSNLTSMPNQRQIQSLFQTYSPWIYFHPDEVYLPSSVNWFFDNGALLYTKGEESKPVRIEPDGSNLPQGGSNDENYWLDLPKDKASKKRVKKGDLQKSQVYLHVKPMLGATYTDIVIWIFYPFNGPSQAKMLLPFHIPLGKIGEHIGDWEHLTLRISNFNGELQSVYFSEHSRGSWVNASNLEFQNGNKPCAYSSFHGHAMYSKPGVVLQGSKWIGIRNDTAKGKIFMDTGSQYSLVAAEYLGSEIIEPPWLNYLRKWGPKISYDLATKLKSVFGNFVSLPNEVFREEGPTGPKVKMNWNGDEV